MDSSRTSQPAAQVYGWVQAMVEGNDPVHCGLDGKGLEKTIFLNQQLQLKQLSCLIY
jgi:hypothetical protein